MPPPHDPGRMDPQREQLLRDGYVICRSVIPPDWLDTLRRSYEVLIERYREQVGDSWWEDGAQPRLHLSYAEEGENPVGCGSLIDAETAPTVDYWTHPSFHGLSSRLLGVEDAACADMMLMASPQTDHGPAIWHRDFYPPRCAPLESYHGDITESGPRYVQWVSDAIPQPPPFHPTPSARGRTWRCTRTKFCGSCQARTSTLQRPRRTRCCGATGLPEGEGAA